MTDPSRPFALARVSHGRTGLRLVRDESSADLSDVELVLQVQDAAFKRAAAPELLRRFHPLVLRILRRSLGPRSEAFDLAQEVFLRVFSRIHTLRDGQALKAFVIAVTVNVLKWELRRREIRRVVGLDRDVERFADDAGVSADADAREAFSRLHHILCSFKAQDRLLFSLRFLEEMSIDEIISATHMSDRTLKRHLARIWSRVVTLATRDETLSIYVQGLQRGGGNASPPGVGE